jgi:hypothetical protein
MKQNILISSDKKIEVLSGKKYNNNFSREQQGNTNMATELQKKAMEIKLRKQKETKKPVKMGAVMLEAGYSPKAAEYPSRMTKGKGWQDLLNLYFPDERLANVHSELLNSKDQRVKMDSLKEAYKLKDKYPANKLKIQEFNEQVGKYWDKEENLPEGFPER